MIVEGIKTERTHVKVDIKPIEVIEKLHKLSRPPDARFIRETEWMQEASYNYHNRSYDYKPLREAIEEEIELEKAFKLVLKFAENFS